MVENVFVLQTVKNRFRIVERNIAHPLSGARTSAASIELGDHLFSKQFE